MTGFATAFNEITLVLFTTLAPSGAVAYAVMALAALRAQGETRKRVSGALLVPFLVTLVGLVASATHLGNPDNALYVFTRVGQSPLSNEVCAAVLFLGASGVHWLYQFAEHARPKVLNALLVGAIAAAAAFLVSVAFAYDSRTVVTWDTPFVPLALCLNAWWEARCLPLPDCGSRDGSRCRAPPLAFCWASRSWPSWRTRACTRRRGRMCCRWRTT
ncbi:dimethyl sulfoxide reductase anchor subunit family protein [Eggerthella sinensis]|uniref:dimethyl sulfoxide reductase anchor subunit family protein n=1 Tax=Eggerthella sinensis TaxID=242230 RepID=UPI0022E75013|nr:DmsC/YnfH family molybdoenzyme membrane anchor subunit [Eggerthella sinensis]